MTWSEPPPPGLSDVIGLGGAARRARPALLAPLPSADLRTILAVLDDVLPVLDEGVVDRLFEVRRPGPQGGHAVDDVPHQVEASRPLSTHMSNGVAVVPSSTYPRT